MLNNMSPFQSEIIQHYMAERKKRAKSIAEAFATKQHGPAPAKQPAGQGQQNQQQGPQNTPRPESVANTMSGSQQGGMWGQGQSLNQ